VKVLDFGLALTAPDTRLTATGMLVGSMHYIAPEQVRGETHDARSDLYAVGVTLYEMITGNLPIEGTSYAQVIGGLLQRDPVSPTRVNPVIPAEISAVVMKALAKEKRERWQTASEFLAALDAVKLGQAAQVRVSTAGSLAPTLTSMAAAPVVDRPKYEPEQLNEITLKLAHYVGPIASVLVKRASGSATDLQALVEQVAKEIELPDARKKFLTSVGGQFRKSGAF
jgi:serine/threonine protein kinase